MTRFITLIAAISIVVAVLEGRTVRQARAELQQLRSERAQVQAGVATAWKAQSLDEMRRALRAADDFLADPSEGLGRAGGLCAGGRLDDDALVTSVFGTFLASRAEGKSFDASIRAMKDEAYRLHRSPR
jgi:hypothetical protein